jgi:hypothetical protein
MISGIIFVWVIGALFEVVCFGVPFLLAVIDFFCNWRLGGFGASSQAKRNAIATKNT